MAAAREQSLTRAARIRCISRTGAISHQIKALEADLGVRFSHARARGIRPDRRGRNGLRSAFAAR
jgi:DNA-binding transcriptional LysR family regulator